MNFEISGSGQIPQGEYDGIRISGSGKILGGVRCKSIHVSGAVKGEKIECEGDIRVSGSASFEGEVKAGEVRISGAFSCGALNVKDKLSVAGALKCEGDIKSEGIDVAGRVTVHGDVEAEAVSVSGVIDCDGLINAEEVMIEYERGMRIGSIGGSKIVICSANDGKRHKLRLPLFSKIARKGSHTVTVDGAIEGDNIAVEGVRAERVSGRAVAIGDDCEIELVQYSESIEISKSARVLKVENI